MRPVYCLTLSAALTVLSACPAWGQGPPPSAREISERPPTVRQILARLRAADTNGDGRLSKEEAPQRLKERFDAADQNGDGYLDPAEIRRVVAERGPHRGQQGQRKPTLPGREDGFASRRIKSLNGNHIVVRIREPSGSGPFPTLIGIPGGTGSFMWRGGRANTLVDSVLQSGILLVDYAPQGRDGSEGRENDNGHVHQGDLKAVVDYVAALPSVDKNRIGIMTGSFGICTATGALARYLEMPILFLIDNEGPASPGKDITRGLKNGEPWARRMLRISPERVLSDEEIASIRFKSSTLGDKAFWDERDASTFASKIRCPYLRIQWDRDHAQGQYKHHMMAIINAAAEGNSPWTRCNDNPPNVIYREAELSKYHFHSRSPDKPGFEKIALGYIKEMFFEQPWKKGSGRDGE